MANPQTGAELAATTRTLERKGIGVGGETYVRTPRGFSADGDREQLLRHSALHAHAELDAALATDRQLIPTLIRHWRTSVHLHTWLVANVS